MQKILVTGGAGFIGSNLSGLFCHGEDRESVTVVATIS